MEQEQTIVLYPAQKYIQKYIVAFVSRIEFSVCIRGEELRVFDRIHLLYARPIIRRS